MSNTPHELSEEFPDKSAQLQMLKEGDARFARLADEYHKVNRAIHRAECNIEPMDQFAEEDLRKRRMRLKDEIARLLN